MAIRLELEDLSPEMQEQVKSKVAKQAMKQKRAKYGNQKCEVADIKFDSKKEGMRYLQLKALEKAGEISRLKMQHSFTLQEAFRDAETGEKIRAITYIADFTYFDENGEFVVEDVKSAITRKDKAYRLKNRMMAERGYRIKEV